MSPTRAPVLITGGAGFIGSQLGFALTQLGHPVTLVDNMRYGHLDNLIVDGQTFGTFRGLDIRDPRFFAACEGIDTLFHFAGIAPLPVCQANPQEAFDINTSGTGRILDAACKAGVRRVIFSSTSAVYECNEKVPHAETDAVKPNLVYASSKRAAEELCRAYAENYGLDIIICRFFNVYGPHQDFQRKSPPFTSYVARELAMGRQPVLFNGSTEAKRDYVYVDDVTRLLHCMLESTQHFSAEIFNIGSGQAYSVPELYGRLAAIAKSRIEPQYKDPETFWNAYEELFCGPKHLSRERVRKEVFKHSCADMSKTESTFAWQAKTDIESGLRAVYDYTTQRLGLTPKPQRMAG